MRTKQLAGCIDPTLAGREAQHVVAAFAPIGTAVNRTECVEVRDRDPDVVVLAGFGVAPESRTICPKPRFGARIEKAVKVSASSSVIDEFSCTWTIKNATSRDRPHARMGAEGRPGKGNIGTWIGPGSESRHDDSASDHFARREAIEGLL